MKYEKQVMQSNEKGTPSGVNEAMRGSGPVRKLVIPNFADEVAVLAPELKGERATERPSVNGNHYAFD